MTIQSVILILVCNTDFLEYMVKNGLYFIQKISLFRFDWTSFKLALIQIDIIGLVSIV